MSNQNKDATVRSSASEMDVDDAEDDEALALAHALALSKASLLSSASETSSQSKLNQEQLDTAEAEEEQRLEDQRWGDEMVPVPVNEENLKALLELGFAEARSRKGLFHSGTVEGAVQWIADHEDDPEIDQPYMVKKADTMPKPVLTEEEKAKRLLDMKNKIRQRKEQAAKEEKEAEIRREKERRERGKNIGDVQEERDRLVRKRELERQKKEKFDAAKERERLRAEIARDKEMRRLNNGVLPSVLGKDGYNPSAVQYDVPSVPSAGVGASAAAPASATSAPPSTANAPVVTAAAKPVAKKTAPPSTSADVSQLSHSEREQKIDAAIQTLMKYRTGGDGGNALKLLTTFVKNINDQPEETKYALNII